MKPHCKATSKTVLDRIQYLIDRMKYYKEFVPQKDQLELFEELQRHLNEVFNV